MLGFIQRIGVILREERRGAKQARTSISCTQRRLIERPCLEILEERALPAIGSGLPVQGPSASLPPGRIATDPGIAIASPNPAPPGNETAAGSPAQLQNVNNATLFFNSTVATLAPPPAPLNVLPPSALFPTINISAFGSPAQSSALSSLGTINPSQPLSVSSLSAYIAVRSASSASVPAGSFAPRTNIFTRYPFGEEAQEEPVKRPALDYVWAITGFNSFSQTAPLEGLIPLVFGTDHSPSEQ